MFFKQAGIIFLFCLLPAWAWGEHVHWMGDYQKAHLKAKKYARPMVILVVKQHDPSSDRILRQVFTDRDYIHALNRQTVPVIVTYESQMNYPVEIYYTTVFPTLFYVDPQQEIFLKRPLYGEQIINTDMARYLKGTSNNPASP